MDQLHDLADSRLVNGCVFCSEPSGIWTRDHVPSRILLDEPYPPNLPVVVACETCNKSFSIDEEYVACLIDCVVAGSTEPQLLPRPKVRRIMQEKPALRMRIEQSRRVVDDRVHFIPEATRVDNVVRKLARGHAVFELSTPLRRDPDRLVWRPLSAMTKVELDRYDAAHVHALIGEVGSRASQRMMVVTATMRAATGEQVAAPLFVTDWIDVQDGRYRYLAVDDAGGATIRIVIGEYLACEVSWLR